MPLYRIRQLRHDKLTIVDRHGVDAGHEEGQRIRPSRMPSHNDEGIRTQSSNVIAQRQDFIGLERMHARNPDQRRTDGPKKVIDRLAVSQIGDRRAVTARFERRGDVLKAERLDREEGTESEAIVLRLGTQEQDVHTTPREAIIQPR